MKKTRHTFCFDKKIIEFLQAEAERIGITISAYVTLLVNKEMENKQNAEKNGFNRSNI